MTMNIYLISAYIFTAVVLSLLAISSIREFISTKRISVKLNKYKDGQ